MKFADADGRARRYTDNTRRRCLVATYAFILVIYNMLNNTCHSLRIRSDIGLSLRFIS